MSGEALTCQATLGVDRTFYVRCNGHRGHRGRHTARGWAGETHVHVSWNAHEDGGISWPHDLVYPRRAKRAPWRHARAVIEDGVA